MFLNDPFEFSIRTFPDNRGCLGVIEPRDDIPFEIKRVYYLFNSLPNTLRGEHGHYELQQVMVAINGRIKVTITNGRGERCFLLGDPSVGLYIPSKAWRSIEMLQKESVLMVLASTEFDENDYCHDLSVFKKIWDVFSEDD
jgi:dTDP-4-dehydrorhamnose 3,5-epimerase-like enzyme